jgi:hypothetical protein
MNDRWTHAATVQLREGSFAFATAQNFSLEPSGLKHVSIPCRQECVRRGDSGMPCGPHGPSRAGQRGP